MNIIRSNIANAVTCINLLSGCVAIAFAFHPLSHYGTLPGWQCACIAIAVAAVADFCDGFVARILHTYSEFGKQLDSLSDLVSFGVAPAMLVMNLLDTYQSVPHALIYLTLFIPLCGGIRLARFNIDTRRIDGFIGLPIPANAIFWIGWAALAQSGWTPAVNPIVVAAAIIFEGYAMVSRIRLLSLKFKKFGWKGNEGRWILIAASAAMIIPWGLTAFCPVIFIYILLSVYFRK